MSSLLPLVLSIFVLLELSSRELGYSRCGRHCTTTVVADLSTCPHDLHIL
jgi:hypothetical protein